MDSLLDPLLKSLLDPMLDSLLASMVPPCLEKILRLLVEGRWKDSWQSRAIADAIGYCSIFATTIQGVV